MFENPELAERVEKHGDRFVGSGRDLVIEAVELDDVTEVNLAGGAQRKMEI
jgi:hypothetical protein